MFNKKKKLFILILIALIIVFIIFYCIRLINLKNNSVYYFKKVKNNYIFMSKKINKSTFKQFLRIYSKEVNDFYKKNHFMKNFDITNYELYIIILKNSFKEIETYDKMFLKYTKKLKKIDENYSGYFEDLKYFDFDDKFINGRYYSKYNIIFIESDSLSEIIEILISEINHFIISMNKNYNKIQKDIKNYFDSSYISLVDDAITNLYSRIFHYTSSKIINNKILNYTINNIKFELKNKNIKQLEKMLYYIKYKTYDYSKPEKNKFNFEYIFLIYIYDHYGYRGIIKLIKSLYNNPYRGIDNLFNLLYNDNFENIMIKSKNYFLNEIKNF